MRAGARKTAAQALSFSKADQTEVVVAGGRSALTRFANNTIHQNVSQENLSVSVRAVFGKRIGVASSNDTSKRGLRRLVETACEIAKSQGELPDFPGLPEGQPIAEVEAYSRETAGMTPAGRAALAREVIETAASERAVASGSVAEEDSSVAVVNSLGAHAWERTTQFAASSVVEKDTGAGWAGGVSWTNRRVDVARIARTALRKCLDSRDPQPLEPGEYTVVLEPQAVAGLVSYTAYMGFGAQSLLEGRSFLAGRIGEKIMHESVSIWDDGLDEEGLPSTFDMEGVPKRRVNLVENGSARGVVYDTYNAAKAGLASTGHSLGPGFSAGPLPTNLFMAPGASSPDEMVRSTERGVLVTRFHYVNIAEAKEALLTGLTRDGTFLIEDGQIRHPVRNLRFTESMLRAFSAVEAISADRSLEDAMLGAAMVPAVKISSFRFTGSTAS